MRVCDVALIMRLRPGCRSRETVSGPAADGVTYPQGKTRTRAARS